MAAFFAIPAVLVLLISVYQARQGLTVLIFRFLDPDFALAAFVVVLLTGAWRLAAVSDAFLSARRRRVGRRWEIVVLAALLVAVVAPHAYGAYYTRSLYDMDMQIFFGSEIAVGPGPEITPDASGNLPSGASLLPYIVPGTLEPAVTPRPNSSRITFLLTGVDSYVGRGEQLNDTLLVVSIDEASKTIAMVSVPRDTAGFPYYWGGKAPSDMRINTLVGSVRRGWVKSPDEPMTTLVKEIGYLVGVEINYYADIDLASFMKLIDKVGGVCVDNPSAIDDPTYDWLDGSPPGFHLDAGRPCLDGRLALAYVRSRHGYHNNDYQRAGRQQQLLVALERKLADPGMVLSLPAIMKQTASMIRFNYPPSRIADMVALAQEIPPQNISTNVLGPPYTMENSDPASKRWVSCLKLDKVAPLSVQLFGKDSRYYGKTQAPTCFIVPAATPKPSAKSTATPGPSAPSAAPEPTATPGPTATPEPTAS